MGKFSDFVLQNENADISRLLLRRDNFAGIDLELAVNTIEVRRKIRRKVPSWYGNPELAYPLKLSGEQCSSEETAGYKVSLLLKLYPSGNVRVADLTGGLGVDSWAFSRVAARVLYNEMNPLMAEAAARNFSLLGRENIIVRSEKIEAGDGSAGRLLSGFHPDLISLDPARRSGDGSKVFLPEHCSPDVISLKDELFRFSRHILVKLSPMVDIGLILKRMGKECRELHILSSGGECKETVVLLDREFSGECTLTAASGPECISFTLSQERDAACELIGGAEELKEGSILFEPGKALMKAGAFNLLCRRYPLKKIGYFTHYYLYCPDEGGEFPSELAAAGKFFRIREILPLDGRNIREAGKRYGRGEVTARNIKMDTETLRKKLGVSSGGDVHFFGLHCDFRSGQENVLIAADIRNSWNRRSNECRPGI